MAFKEPSMKLVRGLLNFEAEEEGKVLLLLLFGFFVGVFNVTFFVQASSSFLNIFDEKADLPKAIICSGLLGVFSAWILSILQTRITFVNLTFIILTIILFSIIALRIGFEFKEYVREMTFLSYVMVGPFNAITILLFWGMVGRLFSIKQTKRIIGSIDSGQLVGTIVASFSIPVILTFMVGSVNLLVIGGISLIFTLIIFFIIYLRYPSDLTKLNKDEDLKKEYSFSQLIKKKYVIGMAAFIVIAMIATIFIDYSFLQVTAQNYPEEKELAIFLARFEGTILIFSFLVQTFVTDRLIAMYGLKVTLLVTPIVLLIFTVITMFIGITLEFGQNSEFFILFFLSVSLSKLFNTALRDAIDGPTFKLYFLPFDSAVRLDVQTKIEGVVKLFAGLIAGLILIAIESTSIFSVHYISFFVLAIISAWIFVTSKLHKKYKETLQNTLATFQRKEEKVYKTEHTLGNLLKKQLEQEDTEKVLQTLFLIEKLYPSILEEALQKAILIPDLHIQTVAEEKLRVLKTDLYKAKEELDEDTLALVQLNENFSTGFIEGGNLLKRMVKSKEVKDRIIAAKLFRFKNNLEHLYLFNELLKDHEKDVVTAAIYTVKYTKYPETYPSVIELLGVPEFTSIASGVLISMGDEVIPALEVAFQKPGQRESVLYKIVYIYGQMGSDLAIEKLWQKISYPDFHLVSLILRSFYFWKITVNDTQANIIKGILEHEIRKVAWNISAQIEIGEEQYNEYLRGALEEEIDYNFDIIYILLSLLYEEQSIQLVRDNIEAGTSEGRVFALELLDIFIAKDIKNTLFPLLDDVPSIEKVRNLQLHFPRESFDSVEVLKQIINRDYNNIGKWTKACALYSYALTPRAAISDDLIANFFNPNNLIRETAAWAVVKKDKVTFRQILARIINQRRYNNDGIVRELSAFIDGEHSRLLRIEKIMFLKEISLFANLPGYIMAEIVDEIKEVKLKDGVEVELSDGHSEPPFIIMYNGTVTIVKNGKAIKTLTDSEVFGEMEVISQEERALKVISNGSSLLFTVDRLKLYEFVTRYYEFVNNFIIVEKPNPEDPLGPQLSKAS